MYHYALIGYPLDHSASPELWTDYFAHHGIDADYVALALPSLHDIEPLLDRYDGLNITIPYKQSIIPSLTALDPVAQAIGAVNTVCRRVGYNTDWIGFRDSLMSFIPHTDISALVLGSGGVSRAVRYTLDSLAIPYTIVSRHPQQDMIGYDWVTDDMVSSHRLIINATPLGMYPHTDNCPDIPYQAIGPNHYLFDCVYNPPMTRFLSIGHDQGAATCNGMQMLHRQALAAWKIFEQPT